MKLTVDFDTLSLAKYKKKFFEGIFYQMLILQNGFVAPQHENNSSAFLVDLLDQSFRYGFPAS